MTENSMNEQDKQIEALILKYARQEPLSVEEQAMLDEWRRRSSEHDAVPDQFRDEEWVGKNLARLSRIPSDRIWDRISQRVKDDKRNKRRLPGRIKALISKTPWYKTVAVAAAAVFLGFVVSRLFIPQGVPDGGTGGKSSAVLAGTDDPMPSIGSLAALAASAVAGNHKEVATLSNGPNSYHILSTGLTRAEALVLPDGSKVWLSYASSLCYPTTFTGPQRLVRLSGEAFFEISKNLSRPFIVESQHGLTQDRSTRFNVKAYADDPDDRVTLIQGSVVVRNGKDSMDLDEPMDQARLAGAGAPLQKEKSNVGALAWRRGIFHFAGTDLRTAMRELARWYHKTVRYGDGVQGVPIDIDLEQEMSWDQVLDAMRKIEHGFAQFSVAGDGVTVSAAVAN